MFPHLCKPVLVRNMLCESVSTISNMFDILLTSLRDKFSLKKFRAQVKEWLRSICQETILFLCSFPSAAAGLRKKLKFVLPCLPSCHIIWFYSNCLCLTIIYIPKKIKRSLGALPKICNFVDNPVHLSFAPVVNSVIIITNFFVGYCEVNCVGLH